jgi:uncharacterized integral membrane protein
MHHDQGDKQRNNRENNRSGRTTMQLLLILGIGVAIAAVAFALQNSTTVTVALGLWSFDSSLAMVLLLAMGIGAIIALLVSWPGIIKSLWAGSRLRRKVNKLEGDKAELERRVTQLEEELARVSPEPLPEEPPRYLGLKSLLLGGEAEKPKE